MKFLNSLVEHALLVLALIMVMALTGLVSSVLSLLLGSQRWGAALTLLLALALSTLIYWLRHRK